jgi:hypothetical protein
VIGLIAADRGLATAIALASIVYVAAAALLLAAILFFVRQDVARTGSRN